VSEDYKIQLSVKRGNDMVNVRANTATELQAIVDEAKTKDDLMPFFVSPPKANAASVVGTGPAAPATSGGVTVQDVTDETKPPSDIEALENLKKIGAVPADDRAAKIRALLDAKKGK
jgi:hypothetical protein